MTTQTDDVRSDQGLAASHSEPDPGQSSPFDRRTWDQLAARGVTGACVPTELGGRGLGARQTAALLEEAGYDVESTGLVFAAAAHLLACLVPLVAVGSPSARAELVPRLASGELVAANAMTEQDAGSDVSQLRTTARRTADGWVLNGHKSFASNAPVADVLITYACTDRSAGFLGNTGFVVDRHAPGVSVQPLSKMGLDGCPAGAVRLDDVLVPHDRVLGPEGAGGQVFQHSMGWERTCLFALYLGVMRRQTERCVQHVRSRRQAGQTLSEHQALTHTIAEMHRRTVVARSVLHAAATALDDGVSDPVLVGASKITVSEAAVANALDAIQIFGGPGFLRPTGIEAGLRDAVPARIFSGTNQVHRELIARGIGL